MPQNNGNPFNALANAIARITRAASSGNAGQSAANAVRRGGINAAPNRAAQQGGSSSGGGARFATPRQDQGAAFPTGQQGRMLGFSQPGADYGYGASGGNADQVAAERALFDNPLASRQMQMDAAGQQEEGSDKPSYEYKRTTISHPVSGQPKTPDSWGQVYYNEDGDKFAESTDADTGTTTTRFRPSPDGTGGPNVRDVLSKNGLMDSVTLDKSSGSNGGQTPNANKEVWSRNPGVIPDVTALGTPLDNPNVSKFNRAMEGLAGVARGATLREIALSAGTPLPTLAFALSKLPTPQAYATTGEDETSSGETENANPSGARTSGHAKATAAPSSANDIYGGVETRNTDVDANEALYQDAARVLNSAPKEAQNSMLPPGVAAPTTTGTTNLYPGSDLLRNAYQAGDISLEEYQDAIGELTANRDAEREAWNEANPSLSESGAGTSGSGKADTDMSAEDYQKAGTGEGGTAVNPETGQPAYDEGLSETEAFAQYLAANPDLAYSDFLDFQLNGTADDWYNWVMSDIAYPNYAESVNRDWDQNEFASEWFDPNKAENSISNLMVNYATDPFYEAMGYDPVLYRLFSDYRINNGLENYALSLGLDPTNPEDGAEQLQRLIDAETAMAAYGALQGGDMHGWTEEDLDSIWNPLGYDIGTGEGYTYSSGDNYLNVDPNLVSFGNWWEYDPAMEYVTNLMANDPENYGYLSGQSTFDQNANSQNPNLYKGYGLPTAYTGQLLNSLGYGYKEM